MQTDKEEKEPDLKVGTIPDKQNPANEPEENPIKPRTPWLIQKTQSKAIQIDEKLLNSKLCKEYDILKNISSGSFGDTLLAQHKESKQRYVAKVSKVPTSFDPTIKKKCNEKHNNEVYLMELVKDCPYIIRIEREIKDYEEGNYMMVIIM